MEFDTINETYIDGNGVLAEAIDMHNNHVDKILDLGKMLFDQFGEEGPVIDAFCEMFNSMIGNAIYLCCEANAIDEPKWCTIEDFHVVKAE